jgi:hypothetical protein
MEPRLRQRQQLASIRWIGLENSPRTRAFPKVSDLLILAQDESKMQCAPSYGLPRVETSAKGRNHSDRNVTFRPLA